MNAKGYIVAELKVHDRAAMVRYRELSSAAVAEYGGRFLVRGGETQVLEGGWSPPERLVIVEFDTPEQARAFYHSPAYQAARAARAGAAEVNLLAVSGVPDPI